MFYDIRPIVVSQHNQRAAVRTISKQFYFTGHSHIFLSTNHQPASLYTVATTSNLTRSTVWKVDDKVVRVALAPYTLATQSKGRSSSKYAFICLVTSYNSRMNTPNGSIANTSLSLRPLTLAWQSRNNITGSKWWRLPQWRFHSIPVKGRACTAPQAETTECVHRPSLRGLLNYIVTKCYENLCDELHKILYWVSFRRVRSDDSNDSITTRALTSCMWTRPRFVTTLYSWCRKMIGGSWLSNFFSGNISRRYRRAARVLLTTCSALNKKYRPTGTNNCIHQTITSNEIIPSHFYAECFATDSSLLYVTSSVLLMKTVIWYHSFQLTTYQ